MKRPGILFSCLLLVFVGVAQLETSMNSVNAIAYFNFNPYGGPIQIRFK